MKHYQNVYHNTISKSIINLKIKDIGRTIQIIYTNLKSPTHILSTYDSSHSKCCYYLDKMYITLDMLNSLNTNICNLYGNVQKNGRIYKILNLGFKFLNINIQKEELLKSSSVIDILINDKKLADVFNLDNYQILNDVAIINYISCFERIDKFKISTLYKHYLPVFVINDTIRKLLDIFLFDSETIFFSQKMSLSETIPLITLLNKNIIITKKEIVRKYNNVPHLNLTKYKYSLNQINKSFFYFSFSTEIKLTYTTIIYVDGTGDMDMTAKTNDFYIISRIRNISLNIARSVNKSFPSDVSIFRCISNDNLCTNRSYNDRMIICNEYCMISFRSARMISLLGNTKYQATFGISFKKKHPNVNRYNSGNYLLVDHILLSYKELI